jgi:hypothetical protein
VKKGIIALALIFSMVLSMAPLQVVSATEEGSCTDGTCPADYDITLTELEGAEKMKVVAMALRDGDVRKMALGLLREGYTPRMHDAKAFREETTGVVAAVIPFEQRGTGETLEILWIYNPETGAVMVMLANNFWACLVCSVSCGLACECACIAAGIFTFGAITAPCSLGCTILCNWACEEVCE